MPTATELADLMHKELQSRDGGPLRQTIAVRLIREAGGEEFLYKNKQHNWGIAPAVLSAFNKITGDAVVWQRGSQQWRPRRPHDRPGRMQR